MACDLHARFRNLRIATSDSNTPTSTIGPSLNRNNGRNGASYHANLAIASCWEPSLQWEPQGTQQGLIRAADTGLGYFGLANTEDYASTPPIDVPASNADALECPRTEVHKDSTHQSRYYEISPLEEFLRNRRTSISFNPQVTLDSGHRRPLEAPLPKLDIKTTLDSERFHDAYDPPTTKPLISSTTQEQPVIFEGSTDNQFRYPLFESTRRGLVSLPVGSDSEQGASLTSGSTASPRVEEIRTPTEEPMECLLSPMSAYSPFHHPTSLEESSAWPKVRRRGSMSGSRAKSFTFEKPGGIRQARRQSSRRSTSAASMSPASAYLLKWAREDFPPAPDDEGQEVGDYVLGRQIGWGGFSVVKEAFTIEGKERLRRAVKIVRREVPGKADMENERLQAEFEHEVGLWRCLSHRHILPLIAVYVSDYATFCFMQLNTGGTLYDLIRSNRQGLQRDLARRYAYQLASAVRYLHEDVRVVHRDIKLENCLIDLSCPSAAAEGGNILLCDFGLAEFVTSDNRSNSPDPYERATDRQEPRNIGPSDTSTSIAGSLQYASPELIMSPAGLLSTAVDMWAFGVVVYALLVGDLPFQHVLQPRVQMMILAGEWNRDVLRRAKGSTTTDDEGAELVIGCLEMQVEDRWSIAQVLESRWLNGCQEMLEEISESWKL